MAGWTAAALPDLNGRRVVVTGASSGIGYETAAALAGAGAEVVVAVRNQAKGQTCVERILSDRPSARVVIEPLDLADFRSIEAFAQRLAGQPLDVLVNNAGVMAVPYSTTHDGFESQVGTNHLGHFLLTARLLPSLLAAPAPRVVTLTSLMHRFGRLSNGDEADLDLRPPAYRAWRAYNKSKLANLLFALELDRLARAAGAQLASVAAHPGYAATGLQHGPGTVGGIRGRVSDLLMFAGNHTVAQSAREGALPSLYAAAMPDVESGQFYGPADIFESRGAPKLVRPGRLAADPALASRVWRTSAEMTGADFGAAGI